MKIQIKRVDTSLPLPEYKSPGAVAFDFICREQTIIEPHSIALVPGNVIVKIPEGFVLMVSARSSAPIKKGLMVANAPGIIDQDYNGPEDEIKIQMINILDEAVTIERGERVAQGVFVRIEKGEWQEAEEMEKNSRGGFGTTG